MPKVHRNEEFENPSLSSTLCILCVCWKSGDRFAGQMFQNQDYPAVVGAAAGGNKSSTTCGSECAEAKIFKSRPIIFGCPPWDHFKEALFSVGGCVALAENRVPSRQDEHPTLEASEITSHLWKSWPKDFEAVFEMKWRAYERWQFDSHGDFPEEELWHRWQQHRLPQTTH